MKKMSTLFEEMHVLTCEDYAQMLNTSEAFPKNVKLVKALHVTNDKLVKDVIDELTAFTAVFQREVSKYFTSEKINVILDVNYSQSHYVTDSDKELNTHYISFVYSEQNKRAFQCTFVHGKNNSIKLDACCTNSRKMREKFNAHKTETKFSVFPKFIAYRENMQDVDNVKTVVDEFKKALEIIKSAETTTATAD